MVPRGPTKRAYGAVAVAVLGWASLHPVAKGVVPSVGALQVVFDRGLIAFVVLSLLALLRGGPLGLTRELRDRPGAIFVFGLLSFTASSLLTLAALRWIPAGINAVLNNMGPLWLALGSAVIGHARRRLLLACGAVVAFLGVVFVVLPGSVGPDATLNWRGIALSATSSFVIAGQAVYGRRLLPGRDPFAVTALAAGMATGVILLFLPFAGGVRPLLTATSTTKVALVYLGLGATALNFASWSYALQHLPAVRAMNFQNLVPPIGVALAVIFLGEPLTPLLAVGVALIIGGTWLAQRGALEAAAGDDADGAQPGCGPAQRGTS